MAYILLNIQAAGMSVADPTLASFAVRLDVAATGGSVASKLRRVFLSAVVGAAFGVLSALAQATFYHLGFDPVVPAGHFVGSAEIEGRLGSRTLGQPHNANRFDRKVLSAEPIASRQRHFTATHRAI